MDIYFLIELFIILFLLGIIDSAFGQGYGTIGTPILILIGISTKIAVPTILFSQSILGFESTLLHHRLKNIDLSSYKTHDSKRFMIFGITGVLSVIAASIMGASLPSIIVRYYIGIMVTVIGILIIIRFRVRFTWFKASIIGIISAFNKGLTGGGYGPIVTGGQTIIGVDGKSSIGITLTSVSLITLAGFITWSIIHSPPPIDMLITGAMASIISPFLGTHITRISENNKLKYILGLIILLLGIITLLGMAKA
ncbi:MAG: sulfite exporter TauE/SafE family protein [Thermoplasmata archaeon]|nr:TSUP family transporter [Euryarchaeota archaeon]MVT14816.1 TSUP family transporter [Euryarchaeota archaeon]MVT36088.1 TSUP family transporter [Euryarchaeota archaeon]